MRVREIQDGGHIVAGFHLQLADTTALKFQWQTYMLRVHKPFQLFHIVNNVTGSGTSNRK